MDIISWIRLFLRHWRYVIMLPFLAAILTVYFTRNITRVYKSNALIYTAVGTGYDVLSEPTERVDRFVTQVNFDNLVSTIKSRSCIENTALQLLAWRLTQTQKQPSQAWQEENKLFERELPANVLQQASFLSTADMADYLRQLYYEEQNPKLVHFLESVPCNYSLDRIRTTLRVKQRLSSDMLELLYESTIPQVTERTLHYLITSFKNTYLGIKSAEAKSVVDYYEKQLTKSANELKVAEERVKNFGTEKGIVNYEEQSKSLANAREATLTELYYQESLKASAEGAIARLEDQIGSQNALFNLSRQVIPDKNKLSELSSTIAMLEINNDTASARYRDAKKEYEELVISSKSRLKKFTGSIEGGGVSKQQLMAKWLDNVLDLNRAEAKIKVVQARIKSFDETYQTFAPLGSTLDQLNRDADIAEEAYKENLRAYNRAVLKLKDTEVSNALSIVDPPFVPQNAQKSKRLQLVVLAALVTFLLVSSILIAITYLDDSIKSIDRVRKLTGDEVMAALPFYDLKNKEIKWGELQSNQQRIIGNSVLAYFSSHIKHRKTRFIGITSNEPQEGKHFLATLLTEEFDRLGFKVKCLSPNNLSDCDRYDTQWLHQFLKRPIENGKESDILQRFGEMLDIDGTEDFVLLIFPAFANSETPLPLLAAFDMQLKVIDATRAWSKSDSYLHQLTHAPKDHGMFIILNNLNPWQVEEIYGEIPKKRTWFKRLLKRFLGRLSQRPATLGSS